MQGELLIVQRKVYAPATAGLGVKIAVGLAVLLNCVAEVEPPAGVLTTVQAPVPVLGALAASVAAEVVQSV